MNRRNLSKKTLLGGTAIVLPSIFNQCSKPINEPDDDDNDLWTSYWSSRTPSSLIVTAQTDTTITFSWTAGADAPEGFKLKISTDNVTFTDKATVNGSTTTAHATGLAAGTLYYFYVVGYKGTNESIATNTYDTRFKITIDTTKTGSPADTFILPNYTSGTYNYYVDWGDGGAEENITTSGDHSHTYAVPGTYQIKIKGEMPWIYFKNAGDKAKLIYIDNWGNIKWSSMVYSYYGCLNMQGTYIDVPNLTGVSSVAYIFHNCVKFNYPVNFDTENITNMLYAFRGCTTFNQPVPFNTANVKIMNGMFMDCWVFNQDISGFNVHVVTDAADMLRGVKYFSTTNYDALLSAWAAQNVQNGVAFHAGDSTYSPGGAGEAGRIHLTGTHNWTVTDAGSSFNDGKLILNFDDGGASQYTAYSILASKEEVATFYVISDVVGKGQNLSWAQLQTMAAGGMDIQCHTKTHTDLTTLTELQVLAEYDGVNSAFTANNLTSPKHTAYPYGAHNASVKTWTATKRDTGRTTSIGYIKKSTDKLALPTYSMNSSTDYTALKAAMLVAKNNKVAISIVGHHIEGAGPSVAQFMDLIDYAQSIGIDLITISQLYALM